MRVLGHGLTILAAIGLLALAGRFEIPMIPVPVTLQTLAVTLAGALLGPRIGALAVALWLACGAAGLPVLAGGGAGLDKFTGASAGYLFAFPVAAAVSGWMFARGWAQSLAMAFVAMLIGNALCLAGGAAWIGWNSSVQHALTSGVQPFLIGAALKAAAGAALVYWLGANGFRTPN
jgi:biotin transport system substrate-specific component